MKILKMILKENKIKLRPENLDDLWVLEKIIEPGDMITGKTQRAIKIQQGDKEISERKTLTMKVKTEKTSFENEQLRINGTIEEAPEEVSRGYHTIEIETGEIFTIEKDWAEYQIKMLKDAKVKHPKILICVLDDSECDFAFLTERLEYKGSLQGVTGKSYGEENKEQYYKEISKHLSDTECDKIIIAGPGFARENLQKIIKEDYPETSKKIFTDAIAHTGKTGINEVLKRGIPERIVKESSLSRQTRLVEEFFEKISKNEKVVYGKNETEKALDMGAIENLLVSQEMVRDNEEILKKTEKMGGKVNIISSETESGQRFLKMGGIAGFLRYQMN